MARPSFRIVGERTLGDYARRLRRTARRDLREQLRDEIEGAAKPALRAVQHAAATVPVRGQPWPRAKRHRPDLESRTNLRAQIARSVRLSVRLTRNPGVSIYVDGSRLPAGKQSMPSKLDQGKPWRHPVFGNRHVWVAQSGKPWFGATLMQHQGAFQSAVRSAIDNVINDLE